MKQNLLQNLIYPTKQLAVSSRSFKAAYLSLRLVPLLAVSVDGLMQQPSPAMQRKKKFLARIEWLPVTSHSHVTHSQTDKWNITVLLSFQMIVDGSRDHSKLTSLQGHVECTLCDRDSYMQDIRALVSTMLRCMWTAKECSQLGGRTGEKVGNM